jgi:hypothetical protein
MGPFKAARKPTVWSDQTTRITIKNLLTEKIEWLSHIDGFVLKVRVFMLPESEPGCSRRDQLNVVKPRVFSSTLKGRGKNR